MRFRTLTAFAVAIGLAQAAHAAPPAKSQLLATAAAGAAACAKHMPDAKAMGPELNAAGLKLYDTNGNLKLYTDRSNRVAVAFTLRPRNGTRARAGCLIAVQGMTEAEARQLIQPWIIASRAQPTAPNGNLSRWLGTFKKSPIVLAIDPKADIDFIHGASIVAASPH